MKPTMLSPGTGEQHLAKRTRRSSTPLILTAPSGFLATCGARSGPLSASWTTDGASLPSTCCTEVLPYPTEARRSSAVGKPSSVRSFFISSDAISVPGDRRYFLASRSNSSRPRASERTRSSTLSHWLIFERERVDLTILSQSRLGCWVGEVTTSTMSPCRRVKRNGTSLPLTLAPTQWCPTVVWTA